MNTAQVERLMEEIDKNITGLVNPNDYRKIISRNNLLFGFDTLNKLLIKLQNLDAFDVRTSTEWKMANREINSDAASIVTVSYNKSVKYIDSKTGKEIELGEIDLSTTELEQAIKTGLIVREVVNGSLKFNTAYDVRSTSSTDGVKYKLNRPKANTGNLLNTFGKFIDMPVKLSTNTQVSNLNSIYYIKNEPFDRMVVSVVKLMTNEIIDNRLSKIMKDNNIILDVTDENVIKLLRESLMYSICSMFKVEYKCDLFNYYYIKNNGVLNIILIVDTIGNQLHTLTDYILPVGNVGSVNSIDNINRSQELWGMITAYDIMNKMKGTC